MSDFSLIIKGDGSAKIFKFIIKDLINADCSGVDVTRKIEPVDRHNHAKNYH